MITVYKEVKPIDILAIGIHPDDVELSASGTVLKLVNEGYEVGICDLTRGELGTRGDEQTRLQEAIDASEILNVSWRINLEMADGFAQIDKAHILKVAQVIRNCRPKIILANAIEDRHPDHARGAKLVKEAFFFSGLAKISSIEGEAFRADALYHYIQDKQLIPDFCVDISEFVDQKMKSIRAFKTQFFQGQENDTAAKTPISSKDFMDFMLAKMRVYGRSIGVQYAEGFNAHRTIGVDDITKLI